MPAALAMKPDLISFAAGGNDVLRRSFDPEALMAQFDSVVSDLRSTGADVVVFRFADVTSRLPGQRIIGPRAAALNRAVGETADRYGAHLIDLFADDEFRNPVMWGQDRLHLSAAGHRRVAGHVLTALGVQADPEWMVPQAWLPSARWLQARAADAALGRSAPRAVDQTPADRPFVGRPGHRQAPGAVPVRGTELTDV